MSGGGITVRQSRTGWISRVLPALGVVILGYVCVTFSLAQVVAKVDPMLAYRLAPYDGRIIALYAASLAEPDASDADRARLNELARRALQRDPTAVAAVSTLGLNAQMRGDMTAARRMFGYAQRLSRRDLRTQLWSIEDAVTRGDLSAALKWYDITLRTNVATFDTLFPVLGSACDDPQVRSQLIRTLANKPQWGDYFLNYLASNGRNAEATAALFTGLHDAGVAVPEAAVAGAVNALLSNGHRDQAWTYYASIRQDVDRRRSRDPRFSRKLVTPSQLDWTATDDGGVTAVLLEGAVDISASPSAGGSMLQQAQLLPAGRYRLVVHSQGIDQPEDARPLWTLTCQDGRELGRVNMSNSAEASGYFFGLMTIPADCPQQTLALVARPSDAISGLSGRIDYAELKPLP